MVGRGVLLVAVMIFAAALLRLVPHPPNFAPIVAMALFAGALIPDRRWAIAVPLLAMVISDLVLGLHAQLWMVYGAIAVVALLGSVLQGRLRVGPVALAVVGGSAVFFVLTNLAVWAFSGLYALTLNGLTACFLAAVPFWQNGLAGDIFFGAVLFGGYALVTRYAPSLRAPHAASQV